MSEEKKEAREALLGELESIKSLLSEEEWEHIPLLDDPVTAPNRIIDASALAEPVSPDSEPADHTPLRIIEEPDFDEDDIPVLEEVYAPPAGPTRHAERSARFENPAQPDDAQLPVIGLQDDALPPPAQLDEEMPGLTSPGARALEPEPKSDPEHEAAPDFGSETIAEPSPETEPGPELGPDSAPPPAAATPSPQGALAMHSPELRTHDQLQRSGSRRPVVERRGENPFLPAHIRERLHTHKTLVDIIKESPAAAPKLDAKTEAAPLPRSLPQDTLNQLVDGLVDLYLPRIEAELRAKLREAMQEDEPDTD